MAPINSADDLPAQTEIGNLNNLIVCHGFSSKGCNARWGPSTQLIQTQMGAAIGRPPSGEEQMVGHINSADDLNTLDTQNRVDYDDYDEDDNDYDDHDSHVR